MTPAEREAAGQRIARARRRRGLSQAVLAGLVGRSESWLSQVERGKRGVDSHSVLVRLAEVLRVDIEEFADPADRDETGRRAYPAVPLIEQAMMGYGTPASDCEPPLITVVNSLTSARPCHPNRGLPVSLCFTASGLQIRLQILVGQDGEALGGDAGHEATLLDVGCQPSRPRREPAVAEFGATALQVPRGATGDSSIPVNRA